MATYDGANIFGTAVSVLMVPVPSESQVSAFFGTTGTFSLFGGGRGRMFQINGVLTGSSPADVVAARDLILSYDDGIGRLLIDVEGTAWPYVVFTGQFRFLGSYGVTDSGWVRPYEAVFAGRV